MRNKTESNTMDKGHIDFVTHFHYLPFAKTPSIMA